MARDLDKQLLESVATRRERLREAFLHGDLGARRTTSDNVRRFVTSLVLGAVALAGCAGFSFVQTQLADGGGFGVGGGLRQQQQPQQPTEQSRTTSTMTANTTDGATAP